MRPMLRRTNGAESIMSPISPPLRPAHGGEVGVDSAPGRTVFTVRLPAPPAADIRSQAGHRLITQP